MCRNQSQEDAAAKMFFWCGVVIVLCLSYAATFHLGAKQARYGEGQRFVAHAERLGWIDSAQTVSPDTVRVYLKGRKFYVPVTTTTECLTADGFKLCAGGSI